jgi:hypothetical protein
VQFWQAAQAFHRKLCCSVHGANWLAYCREAANLLEQIGRGKVCGTIAVCRGLASAQGSLVMLSSLSIA